MNARSWWFPIPSTNWSHKLAVCGTHTNWGLALAEIGAFACCRSQKSESHPHHDVFFNRQSVNRFLSSCDEINTSNVQMNSKCNYCLCMKAVSYCCKRPSKEIRVWGQDQVWLCCIVLRMRKFTNKRGLKLTWDLWILRIFAFRVCLGWQTWIPNLITGLSGWWAPD